MFRYCNARLAALYCCCAAALAQESCDANGENCADVFQLMWATPIQQRTLKLGDAVNGALRDLAVKAFDAMLVLSLIHI